MDSLPDKNRKCHRCNFDKSCRELVVNEDCQRWKRIPWTQHPLTGEKFDEYGCVDDHAFMQMIDMQRQIGLTTVEMNQLRNEFKQSHDANVAMGAIAVQRSRDAVTQATVEAVQPLIEAVRTSLEETQALALSNAAPQKLIAQTN